MCCCTLRWAQDELLPIVGVEVRDADAADDPDALLEITVETAAGAFRLGGAADAYGARLRFIDGRDGGGGSWRRGAATFEATLGEANAALARLAYRSAPDWHGLDNLTVTCDDRGASGAPPDADHDGVAGEPGDDWVAGVVANGTDGWGKSRASRAIAGRVPGASLVDTQTIPLRVRARNDAPRLLLPLTPLLVAEDTVAVLDASGAYGVAGVAVVDADAAEWGGELTLRIAADHGTVSLRAPLPADLTFDRGDGTTDRDVRVRGTVGALNAALAQLVYEPPSTRADAPEGGWTSGGRTSLAGADSTDAHTLGEDVLGDPYDPRHPDEVCKEGRGASG